MIDVATLVAEFEQVLDSVYGLYLDSTMGFAYALQFVGQAESASLAAIRSRDPELATPAYVDSLPLTFGRGHPNATDAVALHQVSIGEFKERMRKGGRNYREIANLCLVLLYQFWEDHYRGAIASALGIEKNQLTSNLFGDLRQLRRSILHNRALAIPDVRSNTILTWFKPDDPIQLDERMFEDLVKAVRAALAELRTRYAPT